MYLPDIESLRAFVEAARLLNFRAAARAVALTPAALGQRIQKLEEGLGTKLFHRTTRSVVLTEPGLALFPEAQRLLGAMGELTRLVQADAPVQNEVTVGTRHELGLAWLLPLLGRLEERGILAHLYFGSGLDLMTRVRSREIDCAITSSRLVDPKLAGLKLHEESYVCVGAPKLLKKLPLRHAADARAHTLIDASAELPLYRYYADAAGGIDPTSFGAVRRAGTIAAIRQLALQGRGIAVLPEYFVRRDLSRRGLVRLFPKVRPSSDWFRLVFRIDDPRRSLYERLASYLATVPLPS